MRHIQSYSKAADTHTHTHTSDHISLDFCTTNNSNVLRLTLFLYLALFVLLSIVSLSLSHVNNVNQSGPLNLLHYEQHSKLSTGPPLLPQTLRQI